MNLLFWNTGRKAVDEAVVALVAETGADLVGLAEYSGDVLGLLRAMRMKGLPHLLVPSIACKRLTLFTSLPLKAMHPRRDGDRYTIQEIRQPGFAPILFAFVHLPSKLHLSDDDQHLRAELVRQDVEETEAQCGHRNTVIIGDFNMNPFDKGMVSVSAFNSIPCARTALRGHRTVDGRQFSFFYNPSWNLLGDLDQTPGTYFHSSPSTLSFYWNALDQVIVRPAIASAVDKRALRALSTAGTKSLVSKDGLPNLSDHLPITLTLDLDKVAK